jgi:hypothetical protein
MMPAASSTTKPRRSPAQIQASRSNGAKSNGPTTPEGKQRSSQNNRTHGLRSKSVGIEAENKALYERMQQRYYEEHRPEGPTECTLVDQIVFCAYQLYRAGAIEIDEPMDFTSGLGSSGKSERMARYRTGYTRIMFKGMDQLRKVQTERCVRHAPYRRYANLPILASSGHVLNRQRDYLQDHRVFGTSVHPETDPFEDSPIAPWRPDEPKHEPKPHPHSGLGARVRPQLAVQSHPIPDSVQAHPAPNPPDRLGARIGRQFEVVSQPADVPVPIPPAAASPVPDVPEIPIPVQPAPPMPDSAPEPPPVSAPAPTPALEPATPQMPLPAAAPADTQAPEPAAPQVPALATAVGPPPPPTGAGLNHPASARNQPPAPVAELPAPQGLAARCNPIPARTASETGRRQALAQPACEIECPPDTPMLP